MICFPKLPFEAKLGAKALTNNVIYISAWKGLIWIILCVYSLQYAKPLTDKALFSHQQESSVL